MSDKKEISDIRVEAVTALRKTMCHHSTSPPDIIRAAELLLMYANEFDPSPTRMAEYVGAISVVQHEMSTRNKTVA